MSGAALRESAAWRGTGGRGAAGPRRLCARARVPVVGLPLDANRCARRLGEFLPNTVSVGRLEPLVASG